jgi:serine/threonine protein kinase
MRSECLSDVELNKFAASGSPPEPSAASKHLAVCEKCATRLSEFMRGSMVTEFVVDNLHRPPVSVPVDPEFHAAVARLVAGPPVGPHLPGVGEVLNDYKLLEVLGEGGMGVVYRAIHTRLDREVAVKVIRRSFARDPQAVSRFQREMKAAGKVRHPNLILATDAGVCDGVPYLVMEFVRGTNLSQLVGRGGSLPLTRACNLIRQAAAGLHHAHEHGLVHRDVKPSNLLLGADGVVRVLDLGLALLPGDALVAGVPGAEAVETLSQFSPDDTLTSPGQQLGTRGYTAPEQLRDSHSVDARADVYGLGCTLVFLLTGQPHDPLGPCPEFLPSELWGKFLARDPDKRFQSTVEAADALLPYCETTKPKRTRRVWWVAAGGLALAVSIAVIVRPFESNRPEATREATPVLSAPQTVSVANPPLPELAPAPRTVPIGMAQMTAAEASELQQDTAKHRGVPVVIENSIGMKLVLIPSVVPFRPTPGPQLAPTRPYRLGAYEVTRSQFRKFVDATKYVTTAEQNNLLRLPGIAGAKVPKQPFDWRNPGVAALEDDHPVVWISWNDAMAFCKWLTRKEGRAYRLPTRAEWNWAGQGGDIALRLDAWALHNAGGHPHRIGDSKPPTRWGLYNMMGNVNEPVMDRNGAVPPGYRPEEDLAEGVYRQYMGGSYRFPPTHRVFGFSEIDSGGRGMTTATDDSGFRVYCEP